MSHPSVDPRLIPQVKLSSGALMPAIGLGTFGSDSVSPDQVATAVRIAITMGYRHFDCASVYGNEAEIGQAFAAAFAAGDVTREELWITSKLWNDKHAPADVIASCHQTLKDLQLETLDLYLVHWPFPNFHPKGCDVTSRSPDSKPYIHANYMKTWRQMEALVAQGKTKHIGTSNMTIPKLDLLLRDAQIRPVVNELELHPHFQQQALFDYLVDRDIQPIGYSPIGSPGRPERDRTSDDTVDIEDPVILEIAKKHGLHPASLCVKWAAQRGQVPIPFSVNPRNMYANLSSLVSPALTDAEMLAISEIDKGCRLIKGQVFLWKEDQDWTDLWDEDGTIAQ